ncbi:MAG: hypothetical protein H0U53_11120 [Actinobacteria bacterium]|nr:hypothetical protein [Actinomycetota bacterium]
MSVLAIKSEPLCKLCKHEQRAEIDAILELRSALTRGSDTPEGKKGALVWPLPKVLVQLAEWGVVNPTDENVKIHWRKHCEVVREGVVAKAQATALDLVKRLQGGGRHADPDEVLRLVISVYNEELIARIARGETVNIPGDLMMKAQAELTKRSHSETQNDLLTMFGRGMNEVGQGLQDAAKAIQDQRMVRQLEPAPVVIEDAEYTISEESGG